ncbi:major facilitator superfamily domain-containing protein [Trichoderma velutinum]
MASIDAKSDVASEPRHISLATANAADEKDSSDRKISDREMDSSLETPTSQDAEIANSEYPAGARLAAIITALALAIFLVSLDLTIVATAIPKITDQFNGLSDIAWYSSAFFMTMGGFQSAWGKIYKYFPLKTSYLIAIFIFELGSLICAVAPSSTALIVGRAFAGVGAAGIGSGSYTIIGLSASPKSRPMFTGIVGTSYGVAAAVGPLIGGAFSDKVSWRWCFYINLPIGALSAFIILIFFKAPSTAKPQAATLHEKLLHMDPIGAALVIAFVVCYLLAVQDGGVKFPWDSAHEIGLLVGGAAIVGVFVLWEWFQKDTAMFSFRLAKQRVYIVESVFSFFYSGAYYLVLYYIPIYFQSIDNASAQSSGVRNLPLIVAVVISMLCSGAYISATGIAAPIIVAGTALSTICTGLLYTLDIGTPEGKWIGYQVIGGVGWGIASQIPIITVQATAPAIDLAEVTAMLLFLQTLGGAGMVSAAQAGFVNVMINNLPKTAPGVNPALVVGTGATDLRKVFSENQIPGILVAYMQGLKASFAIGIASSGIAFIIIIIMTTALIFGSTGAVGSQILATLLSSTTCTSITTISRHAPPTQDSKLQPIIEADTTKWGPLIATLPCVPSVVFNAVGTTIGSAVSIAAQWAIDHDLCVENAKAAKAAGVKTYVYCSSAGTSGALSPFALTPYAKMKRGVEKHIKELEFENTIILRPGMILGRESPKNKWLEDIFHGMKRFGQGFQDKWAQDQTVIGRAAVAAVRMVEEGKAPAKFWVLEQLDIVRLGRDEWKE